MSESGNSDSDSNSDSESEQIESSNKEVKKDILDVCSKADNNYKCIVTFKVGKTTQEDINVHSCFLAAKSPVFEKMFFGQLKEGDTIILDDTEPDIFKSFVRYLYSKFRSLITNENVDGLLYLASKYLISALKESCQKFLAKTISFENIASLLNTSTLYDCCYLQEQIFTFITKNQMQLFPSNYFDGCNKESVEFMVKSSFLAVSEDLILNSLQAWVDVELERNKMLLENENRKKVLEPILKYIRLSLLSEDTCNMLLQSEVCPDKAKKDINIFFKRKNTLFMPRFFCRTPRFTPTNVLQYETIWFTEKLSQVSVFSYERNCINICAVFVQIPSTKNYEIILRDDHSPKPITEFRFFLPDDIAPGFYMCFIPNDGFYVEQKGSVTIKTGEKSESEAIICKEIVLCRSNEKHYPLFKDDTISISGERRGNIKFNLGGEESPACFWGLSYQLESM